MQMLKPGTRIIKTTHADGDNHPVGTLGTVLEAWDCEEPFYLVHWDADEADVAGAVFATQVEDHQALKRVFKHGPKIYKKGMPNAA